MCGLTRSSTARRYLVGTGARFTFAVSFIVVVVTVVSLFRVVIGFRVGLVFRSSQSSSCASALSFGCW